MAPPLLINFVSQQLDTRPSPNPRATNQPTTMKPCDAIEPHHRAIPVDGVLLRLSPEEEAFFKTETGIKDTDELRRHIITVHEEAYKVRVRSLAS